jgi:hypothetical protein
MRELARKGWQPQMPAPHGFRDSWPSVIVCRDEQLATMSFLPESTDAVTIRTELTSEPGSCRRRAQPEAFLGAPLLTLPATASGTAGGWGGSTNELHSQIRVRAGAAVDDLIAHFSAELTEGGWPVSGEAAQSGLAVQRFRGAAIGGEPLDGVLMLVSLPDGAVDCWFQILR